MKSAIPVFTFAFAAYYAIPQRSDGAPPPADLIADRKPTPAARILGKATPLGNTTREIVAASGIDLAPKDQP